MNIAYTYSWLLPAGAFAQVQTIIEQLRQKAIELGGEPVSEVEVLIGLDAQTMQPRVRLAVMFTATIPGASEGRYGLASAEEFAGMSSWSWNGLVVASDVRKVSELHGAAANLGLEVAEVYGGMIFTSKKNSDGVVKIEQRQAFDWSNF